MHSGPYRILNVEPQSSGNFRIADTFTESPAFLPYGVVFGINR